MANTLVAYSSTKATVADGQMVTATAASGDKWALDVYVVNGGGGGGGGTLDYGVSSLALRTAAQIGNASGAAAFGAGATSSQTLRVVLPTDQSAIPVTQSGTWNITNISGTVSLPTGAATAANQATEITSLQLIDDLVLSQNASLSGAKGVLALGSVSTLAPSYSDGRIDCLSLTDTGNLRTYDENVYTQAVLSGATLSSMDSTLFSINSGTVNLNTIVTGYVQNNAFATGRGVPAMAEFDDVSTDLPTEDRVYMMRMTGNRGLHVNLRTDAGVEFGTTSSPIAVHGTGAAGTAPGNPSTIAMVDLTTGFRAIPNTFPFSGAQFQLNLIPDLLLDFLVYNADGSMNCRTGSPDGTLTNAVYLSTDSNRYLNTNVQSIVGAPTQANNQVSVTTTSATIVSSRAGRRSVLIVNHGTTDVYLGTGTITTSNGLLLAGVKGASVSIPTSQAINAIVASGTQTISYLEIY